MLDEQAKKTMLRKIPHALYICGVKEGEDVNGFTASWVMQASFSPPLVVNCVKADSTSHTMIKASGVFALSVLEAGQKDLAQHFFKPECNVISTVEHGDHTVFIGEGIGAGVHREGDALLLSTTGWNYGG